MIPRRVRLRSDPRTSTSEIRKVFLDKMAAKLWLAIKSTHYVSQYFNMMCLVAANLIREQQLLGKAITPLFLLQHLHYRGGLGGGDGEEVFAKELAQLINDDEEIKWEYIDPHS